MYVGGDVGRERKKRVRRWKDREVGVQGTQANKQYDDDRNCLVLVLWTWGKG